jgi:transposase
MLSLSPAVKLWYCSDPVDMRLGFDGLYNLVASRLKADPMSGHLFIFRNRTANRLKVLYWGGHGLCLWCQRLEAGRYHFPDASPEKACLELTAGQFQMILDGIDLSRVRHFKRFSPIAV